MRIGIFADSHDHLDNIRRAVALFNESSVRHVLFAGDLVSTLATPPLRGLQCPLTACYGDNEGNKLGLQAGFTLLGSIADPPVFYRSDDGLRFAVAHMMRELKASTEPYDVGVYGHTHRPRVDRDEAGRWWINPGETSGWTFGRPTVVLLETEPFKARIVDL